MNNKELAAALLEMKKRQETCICNYVCCSECGCWDKSCEEEGCNILLQAADALENASDYEKILADFSKVLKTELQAMVEQEKPDADNQNPGKPKSNGDRIRSMSDENTALTASKMRYCPAIEVCPSGSCYECWLSYLQQPAEEETT